MKKIVIMPGGFHPWHAGHTALYHAAQAAFPSADVFVAATADTSTRPFPFKIKKMLAQAAGVPANRFIQVKSPFSAQEITQMYDADNTQLIFVRSEKDRDQSPQPGGVKRDGSATYLQPYKRTGLAPMSQHAYMHYLPVAQFGSGMTSATEIRGKWPDMTPEQKAALVQSIYPATANNSAAVAKLVEILDSVMAAGAVNEFVEVIADDEPEIASTPKATPALAEPSITDLITHLTQVVAAIQGRDFASVKALLTDPALLAAVDQLAAGADSAVDSLSDSDYAEEK